MGKTRILPEKAYRKLLADLYVAEAEVDVIRAKQGIDDAVDKYRVAVSNLQWRKS